jgi:hypothetical protein
VVVESVIISTISVDERSGLEGVLLKAMGTVAVVDCISAVVEIDELIEVKSSEEHPLS